MGRDGVVSPVDPADEAEALLASAGIDIDERFVLVAPGASCTTRRCAADRFARVVRHLEALGVPVVCVVGERERAAIAPVVAAATGSFVGNTTVPVLAALVDASALVVCDDSGPMRIADARRRPTVVVECLDFDPDEIVGAVLAQLTGEFLPFEPDRSTTGIVERVQPVELRS